jgi:hypothetical protein
MWPQPADVWPVVGMQDTDSLCSSPEGRPRFTWSCLWYMNHRYLWFSGGVSLLSLKHKRVTMSSSVASSWINTLNQLAVQPTKYTVVVPQVLLLLSLYTLQTYWTSSVKPRRILLTGTEDFLRSNYNIAKSGFPENDPVRPKRTRSKQKIYQPPHIIVPFVRWVVNTNWRTR